MKIFFKKIIFSFLIFRPVNLVVMVAGRLLAALGLMNKTIAECLPARTRVKIRLPQGQTFFMDNEEGKDPVANSFYWQKQNGYESETINVWARLAKEARGILDVGAYTGVYSLAAAAVNPKVPIFAFEPISEQYRIFKKNIQINNFANIHAFPSAVSDAAGVLSIHVPAHCLYALSASVEKNFSDKISITTVQADCLTIDQFTEDHRVAAVDLMKVDAELSESKILRGMNKTVRRCRPMIFMEVLGTGKNESLLENIFRQLEYTPYWITS